MQIESHRLDGARVTAPTVIPEPVARQYQMLVVDSSAEGLDTRLKTWLELGGGARLFVERPLTNRKRGTL